MTKEYQVERSVDKLGRIVIPKDMRKMYGMDIGTKITIVAKPDGIFVKPWEDEAE